MVLTTMGALATTGDAGSSGDLISYAVLGGGGFLFVVLVFAFLIRLYRRASKETAFVRTGLGGEKVVMNGGALVFPVFHEAMPVNMNTLVLSVVRRDGEALITLDRLRIDVKAEFYVRVRPDAEAIAMAAQTLGMRTMQPDALKDLVEGKFVDALRSVAAVQGVTQPALSRSLAELEDLLGAKLFLREKRRLVLSEQGALFRHHASLALQSLEDAQYTFDRRKHL